MTKNPHNLALAVLLLIQWGSSLASSSYSSFLSLNDPNQHTGTILNEARRKLGERWYYRGSKSGKSSKSKSAKSSKSGHYRKRRPDVDSNPNVEPDAGEPSDTSPNDSSPTVFNPDSAPQPSPKPSYKGKYKNSPGYLDSDGWCHLHEACKLEGRSGLCCPTLDKEYLSCCGDTGTTPSPVATSSPSLRPTPAPVATSAPISPLPTATPTTGVPSATPSQAPTSFEDALFQIASDIADPNDILQDGTPANLAYNWVLNVDARENTAADEQELINRFTLALFYYASNGDNWNECTPFPLETSCPAGENRFLTPNPACSWFGITCGSVGDLVDDIVYIEFTDNNLGGGPIPSELGTLPNLNRLMLDIGSFDGPIPTELFNLGNLTLLSLVDNDLDGQIPPEITQLSSLEFLTLDGNDLSGDLPTFLSQMTNLRCLTVGENTNIAGTIPSEYASLTALQALGIQGNAIDGPIPTFLGNLSQLTNLSLFLNSLSGEIPSELGKLTQLEQLFLHFNALTGSMPSEICALRALGVLKDLTADCAGPDAPVQCEQPACCSLCF